MKKKAIVILLSVLVLFLGTIFVVTLINNNEHRRLEVTATINAKDNYKCEVTVEDENIVKYIKNYSLYGEEASDDGKTYINFVFESLKEGRTTATIKCINTIDDTVLYEETVNLKVNKKSEISICLSE